MKTFYLSTKKERIAGIAFSIAAIVCFVLILFAVRNNLTILLMCALMVLLASVLLIFYIVSVLKGVCILDSQKKTLQVKGFPSYTIDLSNAALLQTLPRKSGRTIVRALVFTDAEENIIATVPTLFTHKQGVMAEPMARELAKEAGIPFQQNVPDWEFDKEKFKEHLKEEAEAEKAASKARRQAFLDKLFGKTKK